MRILVVEDDRDLCGLIGLHLAQEGWTADVCHDGEEGLYLAKQGGFDVILLDRMLPGLDGLSLLRAARAAGVATPVLVMTSLGTTGQVVDGLDAGADDYIVKPFAAQELLARVRALGRRSASLASLKEVRCGETVLRAEENLLQYGKNQCSLSPRECALLQALMKSAGSTVPRPTLFAYVWGAGALVEEANLDNYIRFVRERLRSVKSPLRVATVRGVGYRLEEGDG